MESDRGDSDEEGAADSHYDDGSVDADSDNTKTSISEYSCVSDRDVSSNYGTFHDDVRELFGGSYYTYRFEKTKPRRVPTILYKEAGWVVGNEVGKRGFGDETIISGFLAKLSFECLNKIGWSVSTRGFIHDVRLFLRADVSHFRTVLFCPERRKHSPYCGEL
jgi:hypothetical protein